MMKTDSSKNKPPSKAEGFERAYRSDALHEPARRKRGN